MVGPSSSTDVARAVDENGALDDEEAPLLTIAECRICQEEDSIDKLETPCACNGSLKYAHRKCVQHWCNEKAERQFLEAEYEDYNASNASGAAFCRSAVLILMALLLLRHALFLLRVAGFLLPCYIMAWAISILQRRRQRQEAAALAASQIAFVLQRRGLHFAIAQAPAPAAVAIPVVTPQENNV
ncbi:Protein of unknown function DUF3675 [Cynara cardunculus var. scolymus]|uniref:RING-CH-type domain-containing protein n=1 Tax=Cynara cardunculus var. scolymus TaxID=59895 RepID=A0A118JYF6_CYNCS|nr:Protein of unknown function DUF3675 [Cynara cardunculus var. scolymus]